LKKDEKAWKFYNEYFDNISLRSLNKINLYFFYMKQKKQALTMDSKTYQMGSFCFETNLLINAKAK